LTRGDSWITPLEAAGAFSRPAVIYLNIGFGRCQDRKADPFAELPIKPMAFRGQSQKHRRQHDADLEFSMA